MPDDIAAQPLLRVAMQPVVAAGHPLASLASLGRTATQADLEPYVQLVLSDPVDPAGENYGLSSARLWRFVDLGRRLDFLLAGFGWCRMHGHLVTELIENGRLVALQIEDDPTPVEGLTIYAAHKRSRSLGPAGRWLLDDLTSRLRS